jgi:RND family efflux transporter MFP subunit
MTIYDADQQDQPKRSGFGGLVARFGVGAIAVGVLAAGFVGCQTLIATGPQAENKSTPPTPPAVQVAVAESLTKRLSVRAQGEVTAKVASSLAAQVAGRVVWVSPNFAEGGAFRQGDTLVRIDDADYRLAVVRARSQVAAAREALAREEAEGELARRDWEAIGKGEASPLALREPQLNQAKAGLAAAEAQLQDAELELSRAWVKAPFSGRMRARRANLGDYLAPGAPVADAFATDVMEIRVALTDSDLATLSIPLGYAAPANGGPPTTVRATVAGVERSWTGRLVRVDANVDPRTRQVFAIVEVARAFDGPAPLAPGLFTEVEIGGGREEAFVSAPRASLKRNEFIYVVRADGSIDIRNLRPAETTAQIVLVRSGLNPGEIVVTSSLASPRQGMRVTPIGADGKAIPVTTPAAAPGAPAAPAAAAQTKSAG